MLAAVSFLLGLICMGLWPMALMPSLLDLRQAQAGWQAVSLVAAAGLLLNAAIVVLVGSLEVANVVVLALGATTCAATLLQRVGKRLAFHLSYRRMAVFLGALLLLSGPVLLAPLSAWDARSIWFFHAKIIFHGGLVRQAGWDVNWSHPDYPKLLPILGAQIAYLAGFWNEQLPKTALLLLAVPLLATSLSLARSRTSLLALVMMIWWPAAPWLSNGYADSDLALYGCLGVLSIGAWAAEADLLGLVGGAVFIAVCGCLKNEGALFAVCVVLALIAVLTMLAMRRPEQLARLRLSLRSHPIRLAMILAVAALCCLVWPLTRSRWGLHNDLSLGGGSLLRASKRLSSPQPILLILHCVLLENGVAAAASFGAAALVLSRRAPSAYATGVLCLATAALYQGGMILIYLSTPSDLAWHLSTSADRTSLLPTLLCLGPVFLYLRDVASNPAAGEPAQAAAPRRLVPQSGGAG